MKNKKIPIKMFLKEHNGRFCNKLKKQIKIEMLIS